MSAETLKRALGPSSLAEASTDCGGRFALDQFRKDRVLHQVIFRALQALQANAS